MTGAKKKGRNEKLFDCYASLDCGGHNGESVVDVLCNANVVVGVRLQVLCNVLLVPSMFCVADCSVSKDGADLIANSCSPNLLKNSSHLAE